MPNGRCRMHGGKSTGAKTAAGKARQLAAVREVSTIHGISASALRPEEQALWQEIEIGSLDDEIRLARIQLARAVRARAAEEAVLEAASAPEEEQPEGGASGDGPRPQVRAAGTVLDDVSSLDEVSHEVGYANDAPVNITKRVRRKTDWDTKIDKLLARIANLEGKQRELAKADREAAANGAGPTGLRSDDDREADRRAVQRLLREVTGRRSAPGGVGAQGEDAD